MQIFVDFVTSKFHPPYANTGKQGGQQVGRRWTVIFAVIIASCGSDREGQPNGQNEPPGSTEFAAGARVADLTDAQIRAICADVETATVECGDDVKYTVEDTAEKCEQNVKQIRDGEEGCVLAQAIADCWSADPCERPSACNLTCPERAECFQRSVDECESDHCTVNVQRRVSDDGSCFEVAPAYCQPTEQPCGGAFVSVHDPEGRCWLMNSVCELPKQWDGEISEDECPYVDELPDCD